MSSCGGYQCQEVEEYCDVHDVVHLCTACRDICPYPYDIEEDRPRILDCENFCPEYHKKVYGENALTTTGVTVALAATTAPTPAGLSTTLTASAAVVASLALISLIVLVYCIRRFRKKGHHTPRHKYNKSSDSERYDRDGDVTSSRVSAHLLSEEEHLSLWGNPITQILDGEQNSCNILSSITVENDSIVRLNLDDCDNPQVTFVGATASYTPVQPPKPSEITSRLAEPAAALPVTVSRDRTVVETVDIGNNPMPNLLPLVSNNTVEGTASLKKTRLDEVVGTAISNVTPPLPEAYAIPNALLGTMYCASVDFHVQVDLHGPDSVEIKSRNAVVANQDSAPLPGPMGGQGLPQPAALSGATASSRVSGPPEGRAVVNHEIANGSVMGDSSLGLNLRSDDAPDSGTVQSTLVGNQPSVDPDSNNPPCERWDPHVASR